MKVPQNIDLVSLKQQLLLLASLDLTQPLDQKLPAKSDSPMKLLVKQVDPQEAEKTPLLLVMSKRRANTN